MREQIARKIPTDCDACDTPSCGEETDAIDYPCSLQLLKANQILSLVREEIEKEISGREQDFDSRDMDYNEGWRDCKHWVLKALEV